MHSPQIQLDMLAPPAAVEQNSLALMRPHKWAHGAIGEIALAEIEAVPHAGRWMWSASINSRNGSGQSYKALPKWGKFAPSRHEAILMAADEIRAALHRTTREEQARILDWLGTQLSSHAH
ncbi:hypothetical protein [Geopseudomonas aromaticivorans]